MGCGDEKLSKYLTQTFTTHCNAMICQQVTLSGDAEWPKVADAVIEAPTDEEIHTAFAQGETAVLAVFHAVATQVVALAQQLAQQGAVLQALQARLSKS